ncbi:uncharacterized protein BT62DRAFT_386418 [Guyanagaster necrorhizus]|uniref:Secreted protein n=1 Tax=Guyanagaster necrorhizus TaxID=856835 RepID=A0A9P8ANP3_9AGAR|nr:uncharacterized protein BT62DRAFT_386418 [Guyanagaster necrorhizus MCA 3950]KAG7442518.1 hypothetical protein BT62DRAFT_386418 [Guyanagaster necrorhizus MCA 3950]
MRCLQRHGFFLVCGVALFAKNGAESIRPFDHYYTTCTGDSLHKKVTASHRSTKKGLFALRTSRVSWLKGAYIIGHPYWIGRSQEKKCQFMLFKIDTRL